MLHLNIWYVNIIEIMKGIGNGKKISICRIFGIEKSLFTLEDLYGLTVSESDGEICLKVDTSKGKDAHELRKMLYAWKEQADKLSSEEISKDKYDEWRYHYPEFDTTQTWAKIPSQALSDALVEMFQDKLKPDK